MPETIRLFLELSGEQLRSSESLDIGYIVVTQSFKTYYIYQEGNNIVAERKGER